MMWHHYHHHIHTLVHLQAKLAYECGVGHSADTLLWKNQSEIFPTGAALCSLKSALKTDGIDNQNVVHKLLGHSGSA